MISVEVVGEKDNIFLRSFFIARAGARADQKFSMKGVERMHVLIDVYNILHTLGLAEGEFCTLLDRYVRAKRYRGVELVLVYDGGMMTYESRERRGPLLHVWAGAGRSADDTLVALSEVRLGGERCLVTHDRELQRRCPSAYVLLPSEFLNVVEDVCAAARHARETVARAAASDLSEYYTEEHSGGVYSELRELYAACSVREGVQKSVRDSLGGGAVKSEGRLSRAERVAGRVLEKLL